MSTSVKKQTADRGGGKSAGPKNPPTKNAWSTPLAVPKKQPTAPPPGMMPSKPKPPPAATASPPKVQELGDLRGRFVNLLLTLTGQKVTVTTTSGETISGILHTATPFPNIEKARRNKYVLKGVAGRGNYVIDMEKVTQLYVPSCRLESTSQAFTDAEIATKSSASTTTRDLVQADASWTSAAPSTAQLSGNIDGWDQFKANEKLFNVKAEFDENLYTTVLNRDQVSSKAKEKAEQLAREIESSTTKNIHMAEERNQVSNQDYDEEDRYSGVLKQPAAPKLNYAQAAAGKEKTAKSGEQETTKEEATGTLGVTGETKEPEGNDGGTDLSNLSLNETPVEGASNEKAETTPTSVEGSKSKLNATAKEFSFNVNAVEFKPPTPTQQFPHNMMPPHPSQMQHAAFPHQPYPVDPNTGMPVMLPAMPMQPGFMNPMMNQFPGYGMRMHPGFPQHQLPPQHPPPPEHQRPPQPPDQQTLPEGAEDDREPASDDQPQPHAPQQPQPFPPQGNMQPQFYPVHPYLPHQPQMRYPVRPPVYMYYDEGGRGRRGGGRRGGGRNRRGGGRGNRGGGGRHYQQNNHGHQPDGEQFLNGQDFPPPEQAPLGDTAPQASPEAEAP